MAPTTTIYWFRKALRLHDNPSLLRATAAGGSVVPLFILDPHFRTMVGTLRYNHLIESLVALNRQLEALGSALIVKEGSPSEVFRQVLNDESVRLVVWEKCSEPYGRKRDKEIQELLDEKAVDHLQVSGHTLYDLDQIKGSALTLTVFQKLVKDLPVARPLPVPEKFPELSKADWVVQSRQENGSRLWMEKYGLKLEAEQKMLLTGGEETALKKMRAYVSLKSRVTTFAKPSTNPTKSWFSDNAADCPAEGATTILSPYLHFGTLSARVFYWALREVEQGAGEYTKPPVSLIGQLLWREFFHFVSYKTPNFHQIANNPICRAIPWKVNPDHLVTKRLNCFQAFIYFFSSNAGNWGEPDFLGSMPLCISCGQRAGSII
jgi:cryptochrome